jgi:hypothetical protein
VDESVKGVKYCTVCQELSMTVCDQRRFQVYSMYGFGPDATRWIGRLVPVLCAEGAVHLPDPAVGVRSVWIHLMTSGFDRSVVVVGVRIPGNNARGFDTAMDRHSAYRMG